MSDTNDVLLSESDSVLQVTSDLDQWLCLWFICESFLKKGTSSKESFICESDYSGDCLLFYNMYFIKTEWNWMT